MTIVKFMLSIVILGMVGIYLLYDLGLAKLSIKATILGPVILGALVFGFGWGLLGYCPGTSMGALGEGRWDALWGILGMIVGAGLLRKPSRCLKRPSTRGATSAASLCRRFLGSATGSSFPCSSSAPCCCFGGWRKRNCDKSAHRLRQPGTSRCPRADNQVRTPARC